MYEHNYRSSSNLDLVARTWRDASVRCERLLTSVVFPARLVKQHVLVHDAGRVPLHKCAMVDKKAPDETATQIIFW